jgi:hypothetical protein
LPCFRLSVSPPRRVCSKAANRFPALTQVQYRQGQKRLFFTISPYLPTRVFPKPL